MATIQIGSVKSFSRPENWTYTPDDRQQTIEIMGGVAVQDYGHVSAGDKISFTATFRIKDFSALVDYWNNRVLVDVIDMCGATWPKCRVLIKSYSYLDKFEKSTVKVTMELWRV